MQKVRWNQFSLRRDPIAEESDDVLVERARTDPDAFAEIYRRYAPEIERFVRSRVSDPLLAEDITSKVFTKAMLALPRFTDGPFPAWLYRIARNTIIDEYRRAKPATSIDDLPVHDGSPSPEDIALHHDAAARLQAAMARLKPQQREIVWLRLHGYAIAEIADRLQMSENAVKSAQRRAFATLRDAEELAR